MGVVSGVIILYFNITQLGEIRFRLGTFKLITIADIDIQYSCNGRFDGIQWVNNDKDVCIDTVVKSEKRSYENDFID